MGDFWTWFNSSSEAFNSYEVETMKCGLLKNSPHIVVQAPGITPKEFKKITFLSNLQPIPLVLIVVFLVGYFTLLRQSNLVPSSTDNITKSHCLKFSDIAVADNYLLVKVRTTKTRSVNASLITYQNFKDLIVVQLRLG